jgi:hypothetical protein
MASTTNVSPRSRRSTTRRTNSTSTRASSLPGSRARGNEGSASMGDTETREQRLSDDRTSRSLRIWLIPLVAVMVAAAIVFIATRSGAEDPIGIAEEYVATFNSGDVEATLAFLVEGEGEFRSVTVPPDTPWDLEGYQNTTHVVAWQVAGETKYVDPQCGVDDLDQPSVVTCTYGLDDINRKSMGLPSLPGSTTVEVDGGKIVGLVSSVEFAEGNAFATYLEWLSQHHPDEVETAGDLEWASLEEAMAAGAARARYVDEWAESIGNVD